MYHPTGFHVLDTSKAHGFTTPKYCLSQQASYSCTTRLTAAHCTRQQYLHPRRGHVPAYSVCTARERKYSLFQRRSPPTRPPPTVADVHKHSNANILRVFVKRMRRPACSILHSLHSRCRPSKASRTYNTSSGWRCSSTPLARASHWRDAAWVFLPSQHYCSLYPSI